MKHHSILGKEAIVHAEEALGVEVEFLRLAKEIACYHHEKWDGTGYPYGLMGDEIPLSARLMALADVYDALISKRCYKAAMSIRRWSPSYWRGAAVTSIPTSRMPSPASTCCFTKLHCATTMTRANRRPTSTRRRSQQATSQ